MEQMMAMIGSGGGGGSMLMGMVVPMLKNPETIAMLNGKLKDMFEHLAGQFNCKAEEVSLNLQFMPEQKVTTKGNEGNDVPVMEDGKEKVMDRFLVLFFVKKDGKMIPVQKQWADEWLSDVVSQMSSEPQAS